MRYCHTSYCSDCVCRKVADKLEVADEISDPPNHAMEKRQLRELMVERARLKEEAQQMGAT